MPPTVLIVDDHGEFRASARALLELEGFDVVGDVEEGEAALAAAERLRPDVVLLDIQLPGMDGFEVAERLARAPGAPRVVLISSRRRERVRHATARSIRCRFPRQGRSRRTPR